MSDLLHIESRRVQVTDQISSCRTTTRARARVSVAHSSSTAKATSSRPARPPGFRRGAFAWSTGRYRVGDWARRRAAVGNCSATLTEPGYELCGREDQQIVATDEQVLAAGHEVRAPVDREGEEVAVIGVTRSDRRGRRSDSSITALSETPVRAARILTHFRTSSSIVSVVRTLATVTSASRCGDAPMPTVDRRPEEDVMQSTALLFLAGVWAPRRRRPEAMRKCAYRDAIAQDGVRASSQSATCLQQAPRRDTWAHRRACAGRLRARPSPRRW